MNLSFAGCGFLGIYHVGVAGCFKKYAPHLLLNKISGASAGAIAACCLLCDLPLDEMISNVLRVVGEARQSTLGPFSPSFNIQKTLIDSFEKVLPQDAHERVSGKLHISMTRVYDGKNVVVSKFNSREDLLQALLASSFVPVFSGLIPPKFHGVRYMDGGFSNNLPIMDENTITVSPFCGESDICPRDYSAQLFHINVANTSIELSRHNFSRICKILFPPRLEILSNMCKQGFDDALAFLHRNNLINCTRCLSVQSTFTVSDTLDDTLEYNHECNDCKSHRQEALLTSLPDTVLHLFQDAVETANKGLVNWIFKHRGSKLLSVLSLPYTLPADVVYATFTNYVGNTVDTRTYKLCVIGNGSFRQMRNQRYGHILSSVPKEKRYRFMATAPRLGSNLWLMSEFLMNQLSLLLQKVNRRRQQVSANITCQLALTEYGNTKLDVDSSNEVSIQNKMNINFTLNLDESTESHLNVVPGQKKIPGVLSRRSSLTFNNADISLPLEDDTVERILQETARHDAVMAFYYMDENNKVKVTEIYDVTDADSTIMLSPEERENNLQLEFDDGWNSQTSKWLSQQTLSFEEDQYDGLSDGSLEDDNTIGDSRAVFSDPESEWNNVESCRKSSSLEEVFSIRPNSLPESDQEINSKTTGQFSRRSSYAIMENIV